MSAEPKTKRDRIFLSAPHMSGQELEYVKQAFESNYIAPAGPQLNQFEEKFKEVTGFKHCVAVANGTSAIHLALRTLGVGQGDIVLGSTLTFVGSVAPILYQNAELVFVDCDRESWNMDPHLLETEIKNLLKHGKKPKAVIPTELYGQACDLDRILEICKPHEIPVICDSAESLGAKYRDRPVGHGATAATFSFNGNKIITTSGGGMLASDDESFVEHCRYLSTQARQPVLHYDHHEIGYNYRMSNIVAAIGIGQLEVLSDRVEKKRQINQWYQELLRDLPGVSFMPEASFSRSTNWLTVMQIDSEKLGATPLDIIKALDEENIESRPVWNPLHLHKAFEHCRCVGGEVSESLYQNGLCLPSGTVMSRDDVELVSSIFRRASGHA